uniref:Putative seven transmembrane receptor n=1 Tax=Ixodes ricinus TaxID=34613 RepID=A0A0K8RD30_IXORI
MTAAKGRIHCLQFLQVQVQGMFPHKSTPNSKEKELERYCIGELCSWLSYQLASYTQIAVGRLYQQLRQLRPPRVLINRRRGSNPTVLQNPHLLLPVTRPTRR